MQLKLKEQDDLNFLKDNNLYIKFFNDNESNLIDKLTDKVPEYIEEIEV